MTLEFRDVSDTDIMLTSFVVKEGVPIPNVGDAVTVTDYEERTFKFTVKSKHLIYSGSALVTVAYVVTK